jgi:hypothetical protein
MSASPAGPVQTRQCGECTVCCTALAIETAQLRKLPGVTCAHCTAVGCGIHETRYPICRTYYCGWMRLAELDEDWRPDRSGVIVSPVTEDIPAEFDKREGVELLVVDGQAAIRKPAFAEFVAALLEDRTPTYLGVPGPPGHYPARVLLNPVLAGAVGARDRARLVATLSKILDSAAHHTFVPMSAAST